MATVYYDAEADLGLLEGKKIAILGYGSQGHAHALNLRDSGCNVVVGLYKGSKSWPVAERDGLQVTTPDQAAAMADVITVLVPDQTQRGLYEQDIRPNLRPGNMLMFAHGFNIHYNQVIPPPDVDVAMVAPKSPGHRVRELYQEGAGTPALFAVHQDATGNARALTLSYAKGIGVTRAGVIETTFAEETETDLFGEQAVLCGGVSALVKAGFETLVEAGYQPEIAYFECLHELKLIIDLMYEQGISGMRYSISDTAEYGDLTRGPRIITEETKAEMRHILDEIQSGKFAEEWVNESESGRANYHRLQQEGKDHPIELVGSRLRAMMPWISAGKTSVTEASGGAS